MKTEDIIKRLRNPALGKAEKAANRSQKAAAEKPVSPSEKYICGGLLRRKDLPLFLIGCVSLLLLFITLIFFLFAKNKADDLVAALEPGQVEGLRVENSEFNPNTEVTYVRVQEGKDRNVTFANTGTSIPVISRFNASTFDDENYRVVGAAPWALTTNFSANIQDPALMATLLNNHILGKAFVSRPDVSVLLDDPQMLLAFAKDENNLREFFGSEVVQQVLNNPQMTQVFAKSRLMGYLIISRSGRYLREHPQEALAVIEQSNTLKQLRSNQAVRQALQNNRKLNPFVPYLFGETKKVPVAKKAAGSGPASAAAKK